MRLLFLLAIPFLIHEPVKVAGEMRKIMQQGNLSASISLDTIRRTEHLYGLGVAEGLKGEIMILDSKSYISQVDAGILRTGSTFDIKASMLVYQSVSSWSSTRQDRSIQNLQALELVLEDLMKSKGKGIDEPFAFQIKTRNAKVNYHVIDWQSGTAHTMSNHKQFAKFGELVNSDITILGFYSKHHQGVFTHHDTNIHLHVITNDRQLVGHVDELEIDRNFELWLPE